MATQIEKAPEVMKQPPGLPEELTNNTPVSEGTPAPKPIADVLETDLADFVLSGDANSPSPSSTSILIPGKSVIAEVDAEAATAKPKPGETPANFPPQKGVISASGAEKPLPDVKTSELSTKGPESTQPSTHSPIAGSSPVAPAARVPEPEPLPPLNEAQVWPSVSASKYIPQATPPSVVIPTAPFTPPPAQSPPAGPSVASYARPAYPQSAPTPYTPPYSGVSQPRAGMGSPMPVPYQQAYAPPTGYGYYSGYAPAQPLMPSDYWLNQRVQAYQRAYYKLEGRNPYEALLSTGKYLPVFWWFVAIVSIVGALWYALLLLSTGFKREKVYIGLEPDGYIFEEGPGAAHVRRRRVNTGRRWGVFYLGIAILSGLFFLLLVVAGYFVLDTYAAEFNDIFKLEIFTDYAQDEYNPADRTDAEVVAYILLAFYGITALGMLGGLILATLNYIRAAANRVDVPPLPGYE
jgi:hypothetical protein